MHFYTDIDTSQDWLNIDKNDKADSRDLKGIKKETQTYKPEYKSTRYIFTSQNHTLYILTKNEEMDSFAPSSVEKALISIFNNQLVTEKYGDVEITVIPTEDAVEKIFAIPFLRKIEIDLKRPNPDDIANYEAIINKKLENMKASRMKHEIFKEKGAKTLKLDDETKALAKVASKNGKVDGHGKDGHGKRLDESTTMHPLTMEIEYKPFGGGALAAFVAKVKNELNKLR